MVHLLPAKGSVIQRVTDPMLLHFERQIQRSLTGFRYLGTSASTAAPQLGLRFVKAKSPQDANLVANALRNLGDGGFNVFIGVITKGPNMQRGIAINCIRWMCTFLGFDAKPAIPILMKVAQNTRDPMANEATMAFGALGVDSDDVIAILTKKLTSGGKPAKHAALVALSSLGGKGRRALPAVEPLLDDPDSSIRNLAKTVVANISVEGR